MGAFLLGGAAAATLLGSVLGAQGALEAADYQHDDYKQNAAIADRLAKLAIERGRYEAGRYGLQVGQLKGTQRATFAAQGVDLSSESVINTLADTAAMGAADQAMIRYNAELEAYRYRVDAMNASAQAGLARYAGKQQAAQTILGGLAKTASFGAGIFS